MSCPGVTWWGAGGKGKGRGQTGSKVLVSCRGTDNALCDVALWQCYTDSIVHIAFLDVATRLRQK